jgi:16S rRNA (cytosine967-C5)-methyltransferase
MIAPARTAAYEVLRAVHTDRADLGSALARQRERLGDERDRALAGEIATGTLRWRAACDHLVAAFSARPLAKLDPEVLDVLRLSIFQLLHLDRVPASAVVKDAVDMTGRVGKRSAGGMVNAILRRISREREHLPFPIRPQSDTDHDAWLEYLSVTWSHPAWLVRRWISRHGVQATEAWVRFNNTPPALTLRVNTLKTTREACRARLEREGVTTEEGRHGRACLSVRTGNPLGTPAYADGWCVVQDEASQLVGEFAAAQPGECVLDACASPGGKTITMAAGQAGRGLLVAADVRDRRVRLLRETVRRSGAANVRILQADVTVPLPFSTAFDRVLLDAPCSGLGTVRRDPDIKWRRREEGLGELARMQGAMLDHAAGATKPGGKLIYATCSSEPEENDEVVQNFLARHTGWTQDGTPLRTLPFRDDLEAFFAAMLVRTKDLR